ncbi:GNAT family N-acetyltransferase [Actinomycetospora termitidis]|uniref:GNAT family N-acetyltransferase n=1 Tax=Actinomycetospora termitidis TaxID=3053470 RepID=A0ABT7MG06_9PSEU|nr:GNAT family N-acetyltransferase [Actinomycetospora sp. Odt1-22]MDL5158293.1 GNAT family N-acetyltransferase [Actinomycetospora sp. Odt1-22]
MPLTIRPFADGDLDTLVALSLRAFAPVHASLEQVLGDTGGYRQMHPDWRAGQRETVETVCREHPTWVAEVDGTLAGYVSAQLDREPGLGEIVIIAVDPAHQGQDVGSALTSHALTWLTDHGMTVAMVETGGDPGHAPARRLYESEGFVLLPIARYFRRL